MPAVCQLCKGAGTLVSADGAIVVPCPFHGNVTLVDVPPVVLEQLRDDILVNEKERRRLLAVAAMAKAAGPVPPTDWTRQHQLEPAGLTTPTRHQIDPGVRRPVPKRNPWLAALGTVCLALAAGGLGLAVLKALARIFS